MSLNIWWIRRDLRLADNQALRAALAQGEAIVPVFILDPTLISSVYAAGNRVAFLMEGLQELNGALRDRGSYLVIRQGAALDQLSRLLEETAASGIYAEEDFSPYARRRDKAVGREHPLHLVPGLTVHHPDTIFKADGSPYTVYTPYSRRWKALPALDPGSLYPAPERIPTPANIESLPVAGRSTLPDSVPFPPGESEAQRRLQAFVNGGAASIDRYAEDRNRMDLDGTSKLSPYLRFGMLSARQATVMAMQKVSAGVDEASRQGAQAWLNELIWREFYISILFHFPQVLKKSFRPVYDRIAWRNNADHFAAWRNGETGYPIVDAAMRQLAQTGWMHNRARMIVASFLVKDLLIDWRWGEKYFMQQLVDGDPAANNGGWQWTAGTGTDAAPYFRIFNPVLQGKKFDPQGDYVRYWLPELARVATKFIHEPWKMPETAQQEARCLIGKDYPQPIIDHATARQVTLEAYARARQQPSNGG